MHIHMIAAMATNRTIGINNSLPWHIPEDLKHFKTLTTGKIVVMGKNTYYSLGKPLPNRRNVVLSDIAINDVETYFSIDELLLALKDESEIWIIGGSMMYRTFLPITDIIHLTIIKTNYDGDTFFPEFETNFIEFDRENHEEFDFVTYKKK